MPPRRQARKESAPAVTPVALQVTILPEPSPQSPQSPVKSAEWIHSELRRYDPTYKGSGPLTDATRDIRIKKIHHHEVREKKEFVEKEKKELLAQKAAAKKDPPAAKNGRGGKGQNVEQPPRDDSTPEQEARYVGFQVTETSPPAKRTKITQKEVTRPGLSSQVSSQTSSSKIPARTGDCVKLVVTDTAMGGPARNLKVFLTHQIMDQSWLELAKRTTDGNGECPGLITRDLFRQGMYRLRFESGDYFGHHSQDSLYPYVEIVFEVEDPTQSVGIALFIGPNSYSTYITS